MNVIHVVAHGHVEVLDRLLVDGRLDPESFEGTALLLEAKAGRLDCRTS